MKEEHNIPLCRSEFLQDFTIRLGLYLKSNEQGWRSFSANVDLCEHEGEPIERFTIWITTHYAITVNLTLWEDKTIGVSVGLSPSENSEGFKVGFYPDFDILGFERIIEALIETVSISTRLCYDEMPEALLRRIWKYDGDVITEGVL